MTIIFRNWSHPTTGQRRIYVNNVPGQHYEDKLYIVPRVTTQFDNCDWEIQGKISADTSRRTRVSELYQRIYDVFGGTWADCEKVKFEEIWQRGCE